jgi:hypothetical protein
MSSLDDRRQAARYPVQIPVELPQAPGVTRDVSASGVYFETAHDLEPGSTVEFAFTLKNPEGPPLRLICKGEVRRVERKGQALGVAATLTDWHLSESV